jgi:phospholipid transport system transporter-binding protein
MMVFRPSAELTFDTAKTVREAGLQAVADGQREIDLADLTAVDSAAVATLLSWKRQASKSGRPLVFHNVSANLQSLVALYGVDELLGMAPAGAGADLPHH